MSETNPPYGSDEPTASTIAAGKKTPEAAAAPPPKPAPKKFEPPAVKPAVRTEPVVEPPSRDTFSDYTKAMKQALGYRE